MGIKLGSIFKGVKYVNKGARVVNRVGRLTKGSGSFSGVGNLGNFGNIGSSFDLNQISGMSGMPDMSSLSSLTSGNVDINNIGSLIDNSEVSSALNKISSLQKGTTSVIQSGPVKDVIKFCDDAKTGASKLPGLKQVSDAIDAVKTKSGEVLDKAKDYAIDKASSADFQNNPQVKKAVSAVKSEFQGIGLNDIGNDLAGQGVDVNSAIDELRSNLTTQGIDVDKFIDLYKNSVS